MDFQKINFSGNPNFQSGFKAGKQFLCMHERIGFKIEDTRKEFFTEVRATANTKPWEALR